MTQLKPYLLDAIALGFIILAMQFRTLTAITGNEIHLYAGVLALAGALVTLGFSFGLSLGADADDLVPDRVRAVIRR